MAAQTAMAMRFHHSRSAAALLEISLSAAAMRERLGLRFTCRMVLAVAAGWRLGLDQRCQLGQRGVHLRLSDCRQVIAS